MISFPNAKINIGLNITGRRSDGYHDLETIFYPIKINDALEFTEAAEMKFESSGIEIPGYANENLCLQAYDLLRKQFDLPNLHIHLYKNIPIGAGLGGGSADAAFFIKMVNEYFALSLDVAQMQDFCRKLGADCAFFLENKPVFAYGKGDQFEDLDLNLSDYYKVLVMPPVHVSTGEAYRGVKPSKPSLSLKDLVQLPIAAWQGKVTNDFENHILNSHPQIREVKGQLIQSGALFTLMSGSGASVYGIFEKSVNLSGLEENNLVFLDV